MTDKELLELAAKAAGIELKWMIEFGDGLKPDEHIIINWYPLTHDGDALRLAVMLGLDVCIYKPPLRDEVRTMAIGFIGDGKEMVNAIEFHDNDPFAATRRAIVRAAAEIGKTK